MKILAPVNDPGEVDPLVDAGASELYCGVLPDSWRRRYSNIVSPNRREWTSANLRDYAELGAVVGRAHARGARVLLALNALYTQPQYPWVLEQAAAARQAKADALIVADLGLLLELRRQWADLELHLSTGGTVFNPEAARFYQGLGVKRVTLPRHLQPGEAAEIIAQCPGLEYEVFILNSGCKNLDGFCTFLHGVSELRYGRLWRLLKRMNADRFWLSLVRRLPERLGSTFNFNLAGVDSPCLFNYDISVEAHAKASPGQVESLRRNLAAYFSFLSGADPCGACRLAEFQSMGVTGVKIVGRNYSTAKKTTDVRFLMEVLALADGPNPPEAFGPQVKRLYREHYGLDCAELCYYPR
jgi:collagenase-like PrtC family protease